MAEIKDYKMEDICKEHQRKIENLEREVTSLNITVNDVKKDTEYIKQRLDNGLFTKLDSISTKLQEIVPKVNDNSYWVEKVKHGSFWITVIVIGGSIAKWFISFLNNG